ncbi:hypothetical protein B0T24DRAFT_694937 [Lasiosphaeria ovina]|uniref:Uncharacterized protein n=1 Tax=Lasiosphaeria ovina TaxID=92902 RepID=A0AAE0KM58_9PEZI|nr:hypothetical protein B0T24DRAFT_694937 [Lasiosphaeria ovina]
MYLAKQVLLVIAVLSSAGFHTVSCGRLVYRDDTLNTVQTASDEGLSSSPSPASAVSSSAAPAPPTVSVPVSAPVSTSIAGPVSESAASPGRANPASVNVATVAASVVGVQATVAKHSASPTSTADDEWIYPAAYGSDGTLTTDSDAPVRSVSPSRKSVQPNTKSVLGPPPMDTTPTSSAQVVSPALPPVQPDTPELNPVDPNITYGPGTGGTAAVPTTAASPSTSPRGGPPRVTVVPITVSASNSINLGHDPGGTSSATGVKAGPSDSAGDLDSTSLGASVTYPNQTRTLSPPSSVSTSTLVNYCQAADSVTAYTSWSVVHTSTITWYGNPSDYTDPFPPISTPTPAPPCVEPLSPPRMTISVCSSTGSNSKYVTCTVTTSTASYGYGVGTTMDPLKARPSETIVFLTTDKNPAVVYSGIKTPNYGVTSEPKTRDSHNSPTTAAPVSTPVYNNSPGSSQAIHATPSPVTVVVQPTAVVINGNTITDSPYVKTQEVVVGGVTYTVDPTRVVGGGATVDRPAATGGIFVPTPTTTAIAGVSVVLSSAIAVIGGTSFTLGASTTTTAVVSGQTITIGPDAIAAGGQTVKIPSAPVPTEVVVAGGDLITAIGQSVVVIHGTTITYGGMLSAGASSTVVVDGDTITLGPGGVTAHGTTIGGPGAQASETQFAVVGGATITKIGPSLVVINNLTYTVGPGSGTTTTVVANQTITIGPSGVSASSLTFAYPFGPTAIITPGGGSGSGSGSGGGSSSGGGGGNPAAQPTAAAAAATAKDSASAAADGGALIHRHSHFRNLVSALCMAVAVVVFGI